MTTSVDHRTRLHKDVRDLGWEEILDSVLPEALERHGELAARGAMFRELPALGFKVGEGEVTLRPVGGALVAESGLDDAGVVAALQIDALSDLLQDAQSTMGLAMTSRVELTSGTIDDWIGWESVLRALLDGRKVHEPGDVTLVDRDGSPLDLDRRFTLDDDHEDAAYFLAEAGFLHIEQMFSEDEMAAISDDIDSWMDRATPDDGDSWWATKADGDDVPVRVLNFLEKSEALREVVASSRYQQLAELTGDRYEHKGGAEGLVKPLGVVRGLSDLPWHKDCGQGLHAYNCNSLTCGISVTGADRVSGALGVVPGSHRANTLASSRDRKLDLQPRMLETRTGDVTVHCSDTLHRAHPPVERPRKVVYSSFRLSPLPGDEIKPNPRYSREARAELTNVEDRIDAAARR